MSLVDYESDSHSESEEEAVPVVASSDSKEKKSLPSAAFLLSKIPSEYLDEGADDLKDEEEIDAVGTRYNRVAPPQAQLSYSKKTEVGFIPPPSKFTGPSNKRPFFATQSASSESSESSSASSSSSSPSTSVASSSSVRASLVPPQVKNSRPNVSTEDPYLFANKRTKTK
eukprot:GILI01012742.1.p1 GENE.GILI01012742.1~~GILI01012742.1.p1  ORF type:complete len:170 (-),score=28.39 GILI01012742.1:36-545(-)